MCQRNHRLQLCSCMDDAILKLQKIYKDEIKTLGRKEILTVLKWELATYQKIYSSHIIGMPIFPSDFLLKDITTKFVLKELNNYPCFDFKYLPKEGDCLTFEIGWKFNRRGKSLKVESSFKYMSFIFKEDKWVADSYSFMGYEKEDTLRKGVVKFKK